MRDRLGDGAPTLAELVRHGAEASLRELEAQDRARRSALASFVDRLTDGPAPDLAEADGIRRAGREP